MWKKTVRFGQKQCTADEDKKTKNQTCTHINKMHFHCETALYSQNARRQMHSQMPNSNPKPNQMHLGQTKS